MQLDDIDYYLLRVWLLCFHFQLEVHLFVWLHASVVLPYCDASQPLPPRGSLHLQWKWVLAPLLPLYLLYRDALRLLASIPHLFGQIGLAFRPSPSSPAFCLVNTLLRRPQLLTPSMHIVSGVQQKHNYFVTLCDAYFPTRVFISLHKSMPTKAHIAHYKLAPAKVSHFRRNLYFVLKYTSNPSLDSIRIHQSNLTPSRIQLSVLQCLPECHSIHKSRCASSTLSPDQASYPSFRCSRVQGLGCRASRGRYCTASRWIPATWFPRTPHSRLSLPAMSIQNG